MVNDFNRSYGWICPNCGKVNAPWVPSCNCGITHTTWASVTTTQNEKDLTIQYPNSDFSFERKLDSININSRKE